MNTVTIAGREIGRGQPCLIVAEAGVNHNGDVRLAHELVDVAAEAGADAVKFQTFRATAIAVAGAPKAEYQKARTGATRSQLEMLQALELDAGAHRELVDHCAKRSITFLSTPYDEDSLRLLLDIGVPAIKVASTDTTNIPFLRLVARGGRPILLSTGMCELAEVAAAVSAVRDEGGSLVLLQCTSEYPAPVAEVNLRAMDTMREAFQCAVGFSDHTAGIGAAPWAVAAGACVIEKHFTLSRTLEGPDHAASLEPEELRELVRTVRDVERALGDGVKRVEASERRNKGMMQKSLVARRPILAGARIRAEDVAIKRPASGLAPARLTDVVGRRAARDIGADEVLTLGSIVWE